MGIEAIAFGFLKNLGVAVNLTVNPLPGVAGVADTTLVEVRLLEVLAAREVDTHGVSGKGAPYANEELDSLYGGGAHAFTLGLRPFGARAYGI